MPGASQLTKTVEMSNGLLRSTQWKALQIPLAPLISKMENISTTPRSADKPNYYFTSFEYKRPYKWTSKEREPHGVDLLQRDPCYWSVVKSIRVLTSLRYEGYYLHLRCRIWSRWVSRWQSKWAIAAVGTDMSWSSWGQLQVPCLSVPWHTGRVARCHTRRVHYHFIVRRFLHCEVQGGKHTLSSVCCL